MKKRILIYAHYYTPDMASTAQILQDLAEGFTSEFDVTVICAIPSYTGIVDKKWKGRRYYHKDNLNGVEIIRVNVPEFNKSSKLSRIKNIAYYFFNARRVTRVVGKQDYVFALSQPPILGGVLGAYGKRKIRTIGGKHPRLIYCIQDFNPEQIEAIGYIRSKIIINLARIIDKKSCKESDLVVTVGRDLVETLKERFKNAATPQYVMINNWIDEKKIFPLPDDDPGVMRFKEKYDIKDKFVFMYSGNIGLYYNLENFVKVIESFKNAKTETGQEVVFVFVGGGSLLGKLEKYKEEKLLSNVVFAPYQSKENLIYSLNAADVHFCLSAKGIKGISCPSKFYGIAAVGKPIVGVLEKGSEMELLISTIECGKVSEPGDDEALKDNIKWFCDNSNSSVMAQMGENGREYLIMHLRRDISIKKYVDSILSC